MEAKKEFHEFAEALYTKTYRSAAHLGRLAKAVPDRDLGKFLASLSQNADDDYNHKEDLIDLLGGLRSAGDVLEDRFADAMRLARKLRKKASK